MTERVDLDAVRAQVMTVQTGGDVYVFADDYAALLVERDALEAENQRLREALKQVEENAGTAYWLSQLKRPHLLRIIAVIRGIARAALKGDSHD